MNYEAFKKNSQKEYLGFCKQKGFIYSVKVDKEKYSIIALQDAKITVLITYSVKASLVRS